MRYQLICGAELRFESDSYSEARESFYADVEYLKEGRITCATLRLWDSRMGETILLFFEGRVWVVGAEKGGK